MTYSLFIRSHAPDSPWLRFCLASLRKFAHGYDEIVVAAPRNAQFPGVDFAGCRYEHIDKPCEDDYIGQQITKVHADLYCRGDIIIHLDSDCIAQRHFDCADFVRDGQPLILFRRWENVGDAICWREPTQRALGFVPTYEFMPSMPLVYHASTHADFRAHILAQHNQTAEAYMAAQKSFSEFNALGNYAHQTEPERYRFIRAAGEGDGFPRPLKQYWSRAGVDAALAAELAAHCA